MRKIFILLLTMICIIVSSVSVFAATEIAFTATYDKTSKNVTVKGTITGANENQEITIIAFKKGSVIDPTTIAYIDQVSKVVANGEFTIVFKMAATATAGDYTIRIGGDGIATPKDFDLKYDGNIVVIYGDVSGDEIVTVKDVSMIIAHVKYPDKNRFNEEQMKAANVKGTGDKITAKDISLVLQKAKYKDTFTFPVEAK